MGRREGLRHRLRADDASVAPGPMYAALDLGTNNCRMLIATPADDGFRVVRSFSRIVRLGEGLVSAGRLAEVAIERTIGALKVCAERLREAAVGRSRSVATEACRRAANGRAFLDRVARETGLVLETISAREEAELTVLGCAPLLDPGRRRGLVFDIGGGSTEVAWFALDADRPRVLDLVSMPLGVVTLAERYGGAALPTAAYREIAARVDAALAPFCARNGIAGAVAEGGVQMVGTSGTVTTLGAFHLGLARYSRPRVDGLDIALERIAELCGALAGMDYDARAAHPCIGRERADLVVVGCAVLEAICRRWPSGPVRVADRGIREGILFSLMSEDGAIGRSRERRPPFVTAARGP